MNEQLVVQNPIDELPLTPTERADLQQLVRTGKSLEVRNAELLDRLHKQAMHAVQLAEDAGALLAGAALKDVLAISDATTKFTKAIREDDNIRHKLAIKTNRGKTTDFGDVDIREAQALLNALSKAYSHEQILRMLPVDA